jgi:hypothetical protein
MTEATIGHNNPPTPLDGIYVELENLWVEANNWLDGEPVSNEGQMKSVDILLAMTKDLGKRAKDLKESEFRPHKAACDEVVADWKPVVDDLKKIADGCKTIVGDYKVKLARQRDEEARKAREEAEAVLQAARQAEQEADKGNIAARLASERAAIEAKRDLVNVQRQAKSGHVKGLRSVTEYLVTDQKSCLNWIARNDREATVAFIEEYVRRNGGIKRIDGVETVIKKVAV